jgi:hypothetical protein
MTAAVVALLVLSQVEPPVPAPDRAAQIERKPAGFVAVGAGSWLPVHGKGWSAGPQVSFAVGERTNAWIAFEAAAALCALSLDADVGGVPADGDGLVTPFTLAVKVFAPPLRRVELFALAGGGLTLANTRQHWRVGARMQSAGHWSAEESAVLGIGASIPVGPATVGVELRRHVSDLDGVQLGVVLAW